MFPDIKVLMVVRNPIDRFYSALDHGKQEGIIQADLGDLAAFEEAHFSRKGSWLNSLLAKGIFVPPIQMAYRLFGHDRVFLTSLELLQNAHTFPEEMDALAKFLEVPASHFHDAQFPRINKKGGNYRRFPHLPPTARTREGLAAVTAFYEPWSAPLKQIMKDRKLA